jgi:hypothetical protein
MGVTLAFVLVFTPPPHPQPPAALAPDAPAAPAIPFSPVPRRANSLRKIRYRSAATIKPSAKVSVSLVSAIVITSVSASGKFRFGVRDGRIHGHSQAACYRFRPLRRVVSSRIYLSKF